MTYIYILVNDKPYEEFSLVNARGFEAFESRYFDLEINLLSCSLEKSLQHSSANHSKIL